MVRIFPYAVNRNRLEQAIQRCRVPASLVEDLDIADGELTVRRITVPISSATDAYIDL